MVDCTGNKIITELSCQNLEFDNFTQYTSLMNAYCDANLTNARSNECIAYCASADKLSPGCYKLRMSRECDIFRIPNNECTEASIRDLKQKCGDVGILYGHFDSTDLIPCNKDSVTDLKNKCIELQIPMLECNPENVAHTEASNRFDTAENSRITTYANNTALAQGNITKLRDALEKMRARAASANTPSPSATKTTSAEPSTSTFTVILGIILGIVLVSFIMSSVTGALVL
jgi:hypothetical protein